MPDFPSQCIYCNCKKIGRNGTYKNNRGIILQKYACKNCRKRFSYNLGFEKTKFDSKYITQSLQLYFTGVSLTDISRFFEMQGIAMSTQTIYNWIEKYVRLINTYLDGFVPQVGDIWRCDEIYLKIKGQRKYLFAMMDDDSRFIISYFVGERKHMRFAVKLFSLSKTKAQKKPHTIITDGLHSYKVAYRKVFWTIKKPRVKHIYATFEHKTKYLNNKMERWNGFFRNRQKTMRDFKIDDSVLIDGLILYYNFIRVHSVLKMTPAQYIGINIFGRDKWKTLIQNAEMEKKCLS